MTGHDFVRAHRRFVVVSLAATVIATVAFVMLAASITDFGNHDGRSTADCIIVPGARLLADGTPAPMLAARLDHAARLLHENWSENIIVTGGSDASGEVQAVAAAHYLAGIGVPEYDIYQEPRARSTYESLRFSRDVMLEHGWTSCLISTDPFHARRCVSIARDLGMVAWASPDYDSPAFVRPQIRLACTARECVATVQYWWMGPHLPPDREDI